MLREPSAVLAGILASARQDSKAGLKCPSLVRYEPFPRFRR
jgi:hypothetical protein